MAITQYIGARYVPMFFTNPDDNTNAWKSGVVYDPLTIVTDLNQSYTSKIPVPASIGRPSENPEYWVLTGAYNAQVEEYRQEVEEIAVKTDFFARPENYGAAGDGITDDTAAVHSCIADAIANNKIVILSSRYKIGKLDLTDLADDDGRIYNLVMLGTASNDSNEYLYNNKMVGFNTTAADYGIDFPIMHNAVLSNFSINSSNGTTAFRFAGGLETVIDNINFGYSGRAIEFLTGSYWHIQNCAINTNDTYAFYINSTSITGCEYLYFENCQIAHDKVVYAGSAFKTTGNNFASFVHCDFIGWDTAIENVGTINSKATKMIDTQIGCNHIFKSASTAGFNGLIINACNIHVSGHYLDVATGTITSGLIMTNNHIYEVPTETEVFINGYNKVNWFIKNNVTPQNMIPFMEVQLSSSQKPAHTDSEKFFITGATGSALTAGTYSTMVTLSNKIASGVPLLITATSTTYNTNNFNPLEVMSMSLANGNELTVTLKGGSGAATQNVQIRVDY